MVSRGKNHNGMFFVEARSARYVFVELDSTRACLVLIHHKSSIFWQGTRVEEAVREAILEGGLMEKAQSIRDLFNVALTIVMVEEGRIRHHSDDDSPWLCGIYRSKPQGHKVLRLQQNEDGMPLNKSSTNILLCCSRWDRTGYTAPAGSTKWEEDLFPVVDDYVGKCGMGLLDRVFKPSCWWWGWTVPAVVMGWTVGDVDHKAILRYTRLLRIRS